MNIKEAKAYINFCIKEGCADTADFAGWTNKQLIKWAKEQGERGDYYANSKD